MALQSRDLPTDAVPTCPYSVAWIQPLFPTADKRRMGKAKPNLLCFALVVALALQGCGSGHRVDTSRTTPSSAAATGTSRANASSPKPVVSQTTAGSEPVGGSVALSPARVAAKFAMWLANVGANEDEPATPAQVAAYARALHVSCSPPQFGQYPCFAETRQRARSQQVVVVRQPCVAIVGSSGRIAAGRCADPGDKVAPVITPGYVDCSTVGKVVATTDPVGDQVASWARHPLSPSARNHADLTEVRVAATPKSFCADFQTTTPFTQNSTLTLAVNGGSRSDIGFTPSIGQDRAPVPGLYVSAPTAIAGHLGFKGDWASLVIPASDSAQPLPTGPFTFTASAAYDVYSPAGGYSVHDATQSATYP